MNSGTRARDVAIAAVISIVFVAFQIQASLHAGALSFPPTYDDVVYYFDAATRVQTFWQGRFTDLVHGYISNPPQAPGATLLAAIGFLLFGIKPWAADSANALPLFVFVLVLLRLFSGLPLGIALPAIIAVLGIPIFGLAIVEFRPDMWCAGLTVGGTLLIALRDPRDTRTAAGAGIAFAAALLMKPTFSPLVVILFGTALVLRLAPYLRERAQWWGATRACLIVGGLAVLIAGPHYVLALPELAYRYYPHLFGDLAEVWQLRLSATEKALYFLTSNGSLLRRWVYVGIPTLAVPLVLIIRRHELAWQASIIAILALIAYIIVSLLGRSPFVGSIFHAYVAGAIIICAATGLRMLYRSKTTKAAYVAAFAFLCLAVVTYRVPWYGGVHSPKIAASRQAAIAEAASFFRSDRDLARKTVMFVHIGQYMNPDTLAWRFLQDGTQIPTFAADVFSDDLARHVALFGRSDYVITLTPDHPDSLRWLPSAKLADKINGMLDAETGFELAKTILPPGEPGEMRIYRKKR